MQAPRLSDLAQGRDNNFNLIRVLAALIVLITHSYALATGDVNTEPLRQSLGLTTGTIAVDVFFVTSGFLVTASLLTRQSTLEFLLARGLRIFPALLVTLMLTVTLLGPVFTSLPISEYVSSKAVYSYLAKCGTLLFGANYDLPGVFEHNPYHKAVNGSLWTMPHELRMYAILALGWFLLRAAPDRLMALKGAVVSAAVLSGAWLLAGMLGGDAEKSQFPRLFFMFFSGASFYVLRRHVVLHPVAAALLTALLLASTMDRALFPIVYTFSIAYILFWVAYVPSGQVRQYNQLGDYSFGIYIYAFPVQQSLVAVTPGISAENLIVASIAATLPLAVLSWHVIERRALALKGRAVAAVRGWFGSNSAPRQG